VFREEALVASPSTYSNIQIRSALSLYTLCVRVNPRFVTSTVHTSNGMLIKPHQSSMLCRRFRDIAIREYIKSKSTQAEITKASLSEENDA
jgi:hypothetical protein